MDLKIQSKVALVLAASKGLGKAIATTLSAEGADVVIGSRNQQELDATALEIRKTAKGKVVAIVVDVNKPEQLEHIVAETVKTFGRLDILVNNAGGPPFNKFETFSDEQWQAAFDQNLMSFVRASR